MTTPPRHLDPDAAARWRTRHGLPQPLAGALCVAGHVCAPGFTVGGSTTPAVAGRHACAGVRPWWPGVSSYGHGHCLSVPHTYSLEHMRLLDDIKRLHKRLDARHPLASDGPIGHSDAGSDDHIWNVRHRPLITNPASDRVHIFDLP